MRDRQARRFHTPTRLLIGFAAITGGALALSGVPSCADALHLDPPKTTTPPDGGGTGGGTTGGDAGGCTSSKDCSSPTPTCDPSSHTCVGCVSNGDCAGQSGTVCSQGACTCPPGEGGPALTYCPGANGGCVDTTSSLNNCGGCGVACFSCSMGKCAGQWTPTGMVGAPDPRGHHVAVWTGTQMFVWGGRTAAGFLNTGGLYDPRTQIWTPTAILNAPTPRADATAVWTGSKVIVWGGNGPGGALDSGAIYDPSTNTWRGTAISPGPRFNHTAVWASTLATPAMLIFGGADGKGALGDGWIYTPGQTVSADSWTQFSVMEAGAPTPRQLHTAVWDTMMNRMVVFGGMPLAGAPAGEIFAYDPTAMSWSELNSPLGPAPRWLHTAVWDPVSAQMVVFGGFDGTMYLNDGAQLAGSSWSPITTTPEPREGHTAVVLAVSGMQEMVIFGGDQGLSNPLNTGFAWPITSPAGTTWNRLDTAPSARTHHTAVAITTGTPPTLTSKMIVWGGDTADGPTNTGAVLDASITSTN